jgi:glucose-1-phosphate cytidylyltransferase
VKVVLFCGGLGLRLQEAGVRTPKPLMPVGDQPILLHLMRYYAHYGHREFVLCLGHNASAFKRFFLEYDAALHSDFVLNGREVELLGGGIEDWRITFVDTGPSASVGERLTAVRPHLEGEEYFLANYADALSDAPLDQHIARLRAEDRVASVLTVRPHYSTHALTTDGDLVTGVSALDDGSVWINGGFFVFRGDLWDHLRPGEDLVEEPFARLIAARQLLAQRHRGFWAPMDTLKDKQHLDALGATPRPPWAVWLPQPTAEVIPLPARAA